MIDGMTIVSAGHTYPDMAVGLTLFGFVLTVAACVCSIISVAERDKHGAIVSMAFAILFIAMMRYGFSMPKIPTLKAIVKPDADITEIVRRYEVQSIDGQIWELVEKEQMK